MNPPTPGGRGRAAVGLAVVLLATAMTFFDFTAVHVLLPSIRAELAIGYGTAQWVSIGYVLPFALLLITGGRIGDRIGHRNALLIGLTGFTVASAAVAVVDGITAVIVLRVVQGAAGALLAPQVLALLRVLTTPQKRVAATAAYAATAGIATMAGPALGGWLADADASGLGWRAVFLVNLPLGLVAIVLGLLCVPAGPRRTGLRLDATGTLLSALALLLVLGPLLYGREQGWPWWHQVGIAAAVPAIALFAWHQRRRHRAGRDTLVAVPLLQITAFRGGLAVNLAVGAVLSGFLFVLSVHLQDGTGASPAATGATISIASLATMVASVAAPRLLGRHGRRLLTAGALLTVVAFAIAAAGAMGVRPGSVAVLVGFGVGIGLVSTPVLAMTMSAVPDGAAGAAGGLFTTFRQVGAAAGVAANGAVYFAVLDRAGHDTALQAAALLDGALAVAVLLALRLLPADAPPSPPGPERTPATRPVPAGGRP